MTPDAFRAWLRDAERDGVISENLATPHPP